MIGLTARQLDVLRFITGYIEANGCSPSYEEISAAMGTLHRAATFKLTRALRERGAITWPRGQARSIKVLRPVPIPRAPDGQPLYFVGVPQ